MCDNKQMAKSKIEKLMSSLDQLTKAIEALTASHRCESSHSQPTSAGNASKG
jgi:hypothetical protein